MFRLLLLALIPHHCVSVQTHRVELVSLSHMLRAILALFTRSGL